MRGLPGRAIDAECYGMMWQSSSEQPVREYVDLLAYTRGC